VKPPPFEYSAPESLPDALSLLATLGDAAKVLAGGQSLLPLVSLRLAHPAHLVDVNRMPELGQIRPRDGGLALGSMVRQRSLEWSDQVRQRCPLLLEVVPMIGHPQIRNRGTVGGSMAHADPAAELPAVALLLDAELLLGSVRGERPIKAGDFFKGYLTTALESDELLLEIRLPPWPAGAGFSFQEVSRRHGDFALVGAAAMVTLGPDGAIADGRLAFIGMGETPVRSTEAERLLMGEQPGDGIFAAAADRAVADLQPPSDIHASRSYRRAVGTALARRVLLEAAWRAGGGTR
jgi:CO/xanthine dehydrogenase FAD-binding subunit